MKIYIENFLPDSAISRISLALKKYIPQGSSLVEHPGEADLVVICAYGHRRKMRYYVKDLARQNIKYAVVQLSIRSTPNPKTEDWLPIWENAQLVWSYYDIPRLCQEDNTPANFNFFRAPLGVDSTIFKETKLPRKFIIAGTGNDNSWNHECKKQIVVAAEGKPIFQQGPGESDEKITYSNGMDDHSLAKYYSQCKFVSGLRKIEGFELPVIEGLLCGARPICFDTINYRHWFNGLAEFIPEDENIAQNLRKLFHEGAKPVTEDEKRFVKTHFDWGKICKEFWKRTLEN